MRRPVQALIAVVLVTLLVPVTAAAQKIVLKAQSSWPAVEPAHENFLAFASRVEKLSGGRLKIETLAGGAVVPPFEVVDAVNRKVLDAAHTWLGYLVGKHPAAVLMVGAPGGPFGLDNFDFLGWLHNRGGAELRDEFWRDIVKLNVITFPTAPAAPQMLGWFKRPIKGVRDLKGLKIRAVGMNAQILKEIGASVVSLPGGEIVPAAERGVIDAAEWATPFQDYKLGFHHVWKYYYMPSFHEMTVMIDFVINRDMWNKLSPDLQEIIRAAAVEAWILYWNRANVENAGVLRELQEKHGVKIERTPDDVLLKQLEVWDQIATHEAAKDPFFKRVLDSQRQYASQVVVARRDMDPLYQLLRDHYWKK
jgi:TRAP-type mannitol/chloroaromatic compound transport system substrate-binding protein